MADLMAIIAANYETVGSTVPTKTPYFAVNPDNYKGEPKNVPDNKTFIDHDLGRHRLPRQGALPERRHQQISGSAD